MNIHRLALVKWLFRAMFGTLSAGGDATGGSSSSAATATGIDDPDVDPHPPLDQLKAKCVAAWSKFPFKPGTKPFGAMAWQYFYPCEDRSKVHAGDILKAYDGLVKSIFLPDDQPALSRKGGVQKITNILIGKVGKMSTFNPQISLKSKGFRTSLSKEFNQLTKTLRNERAESASVKRKLDSDKKVPEQWHNFTEHATEW